MVVDFGFEVVMKESARGEVEGREPEIIDLVVESLEFGEYKTRRVVELLSHVLHQRPVPREWIDEVAA